MTTEYQGEIVIAPRVLEVITGIAAAKVDGVHSLQNKRVADSWSKTSLNKGVYLQTDEEGRVIADIYVYLEYGVNVPAVSMEIQRAVKVAVYNYAEVQVTAVNIHVNGIVPDKTPKPALKDLFGEDFLDEE
ncbi:MULTISPECIES: Asp23/Gls24 family envelope stress response protein [Streptococcus]|uniref:Asp23/Gls24 family envelope stress response protein n=1 Tax=Streptococcus ruminantium TaxID=1917441 RepID=A0A2Z5TPV4_9STRE|nr:MULTISPECIES: Asp23/Gls24 family envelope stress response protein [Streptococcus]MDQ8758564.1 Asp23/Gls24 family envelope stress response protein [Streptococcus ruminantium]MDQ8765662.1 Asp23/Gls24 family envelope stress response protein [Streptococcus ruminantium]MDQ8766231.1 Asp23/Gls24 family envelope stress response protein [Streptococcus ruminantium]MDQ8769545.1 Asp23/Gls24 family envelope stress response protein [Streptococcus ruminantium]MDQ8774160.1 Asp23/Gls24 family envelope stres